MCLIAAARLCATPKAWATRRFHGFRQDQSQLQPRADVRGCSATQLRTTDMNAIDSARPFIRLVVLAIAMLVPLDAALASPRNRAASQWCRDCLADRDSRPERGLPDPDRRLSRPGERRTWCDLPARHGRGIATVHGRHGRHVTPVNVVVGATAAALSNSNAPDLRAR